MRKLSLDEKITIRGYISRIYRHTITTGQVTAMLRLNDADLMKFYSALTGKPYIHAFTTTTKRSNPCQK